MTWSISAFGTRPEAEQQIKDAVFQGAEAERPTFEAMQAALLAQCSTIVAPRISANASGYANAASLSICGMT